MESRINQAIDDDPFARMAAALPVKPPSSRPRSLQPRRSRPSFSELAPVLPPTFESSPPPIAEALPEPRRPAPIPFVPSVIVADAPRASAIVRTDERPATATVRGHRLRIATRRGGSLATALLLLCLSIAVFGIGIAALVSAKTTKSARAASTTHTLVSAKR